MSYRTGQQWDGWGLRAWLVVGAICLGGVSGCVERTITIRTRPSGALVLLNDEEVGRSPLKVPFLWYGDYDVTVRMEGYQTLHTHKRTPKPWYQFPPFDLMTEALMPFTVRDQHEWEFDLAKMEPVDPDTLLSEALKLRAEATGESVETAQSGSGPPETTPAPPRFPVRSPSD